MRIRLLLAGLACSAMPLTAQSPAGLDPSGLRVFWQAVDGLAARAFGPDSARRVLETHPGYRLIQRTGSRLPVIIHCLWRRYPPSAADTAPTPPASRAWLYDRVCTHLTRALAERRDLEQYAAALEASPAERPLIEAAIDSARAYLPPTLAGLSTPPIYLLLFEDNGFGAEGIALDLLSFRDKTPDRRVLTLGHELHHAFMVQRRSDLNDEADGEGTPAAVWWLGRVQWEGIASLIDKRAWLGLGPSGPEAPPPGLEGFPAEHAAATRAAPERIRRLDAALTSAAGGGISPAGVDSAFRASIPDGGHALGHFLAAVIERELGARRLARTALRRFDFLAAYQEAARRRPRVYPAFGPAALAYFEELAGRYQATGR